MGSYSISCNYTGVILNFTLKQPGLWSTKHTRHICFNYSREGRTDQKESLPMLKEIKCLPSRDASAAPPLMLRLPSWVPRPYGLDVCVLLCFLGFVRFKPWKNVALTCWMFFVLRRYKTVYLREIWEAVFQPVVLGLAPIKLSSIPVTDCLLTIFTDKGVRRSPSLGDGSSSYHRRKKIGERSSDCGSVG